MVAGSMGRGFRITLTPTAVLMKGGGVRGAFQPRLEKLGRHGRGTSQFDMQVTRKQVRRMVGKNKQ